MGSMLGPLGALQGYVELKVSNLGFSRPGLGNHGEWNGT